MIGIILLLSPLSAAWSEMESVSWSFFFISSSIFGTTPQVESDILRIERLRPFSSVTSSMKRMTLSKLSSGSPMPMSTICDTLSPSSR